MYTATVLITIAPDGFVPMSGIIAESKSIIANLGRPQDTSPPSPQPAVFSGGGESIQITVPPNYQGSVQLTYQLPSNRYTLVGIAFTQATPAPTQQAQVTESFSRMEFPQVIIQRDMTGSQMIVTDECLDQFNNVVFDYVILVQDIETGNIGLIDPDVETGDGGN